QITNSNYALSCKNRNGCYHLNCDKNSINCPYCRALEKNRCSHCKAKEFYEHKLIFHFRYLEGTGMFGMCITTLLNPNKHKINLHFRKNILEHNERQCYIYAQIYHKVLTGQCSISIDSRLIHIRKALYKLCFPR